jgi:non-ribosomal peptide synthetase component E (peptide arylation enzyme)
MILGDPAQAPAQAPRGQIRVSIDEMFRRLAERRPDAPALADPPNRKNFTDGAPRRLTYAEADRMVAAIAGRLRRMGLPVDAVIGVQMPNIVENILAMLGVLRAGMVVAPLPLLWRRADAVAALARVGAKALIPAGASAISSTARSACAWPRKCSPSATCAASAPTCLTAWCRSTICSRPTSSTPSRRSSASGRPPRRRTLRRSPST